MPFILSISLGLSVFQLQHHLVQVIRKSFKAKLLNDLFMPFHADLSSQFLVLEKKNHLFAPFLRIWIA